MTVKYKSFHRTSVEAVTDLNMTQMSVLGEVSLYRNNPNVQKGDILLRTTVWTVVWKPSEHSQFHACAYNIVFCWSALSFVYYITFFTYDNEVTYSEFWEIIKYVVLLWRWETICFNHNKPSFRIPEIPELIFLSKISPLISAIILSILPYDFNILILSFNIIFIYKVWFFGYSNITIKSNNDRPDSSSLKLCNHFLLNISFVGRWWYHQRSHWCEITVADFCQTQNQMYFL